MGLLPAVQGSWGINTPIRLQCFNHHHGSSNYNPSSIFSSIITFALAVLAALPLLYLAVLVASARYRGNPDEAANRDYSNQERIKAVGTLTYFELSMIRPSMALYRSKGQHRGTPKHSSPIFMIDLAVRPEKELKLSYSEILFTRMRL
jgi:hypothetical protein